MTPNQSSAEVSNRLVGQFDARIWAEEYCKINPSADFGTMLGWFANAIMAGHDNAMRKQDAIAQAAKDGEEIARLRAELAEVMNGYSAYKMNSLQCPTCGGYHDSGFLCPEKEAER